MPHPFRRSPAEHRPTQQRAPDSDGLEVTEGNDESDWALWEDSVQNFDSSVMPIDPFEKVGKNHS